MSNGLPPVSGDGATTTGVPSASARSVKAPRCPSTAETSAWMTRTPPPTPEVSPGGTTVVTSSAAPIPSATAADSAIEPMRATRPDET